jgi:hypothetical protein
MIGIFSCGCGLECIHHIPPSLRRRRKWNQVSGGQGSYLGALWAASTLPLVRGWKPPSGVPRKTELRERPDLLKLRLERRGFTAPSKLQRLQSCETDVAAQKVPASDKTRIIKENILLEIHDTRSIVRCCSPRLRTAGPAATITTATTFRTPYVSRPQSNLRSVNSG